MKTTVIQLEPHDDLVSIKDKMSWNLSPRIVLVWPKRGKVLNHLIDLSLINRAASSYGAQLALVVHDAVIRENAIVLDIPVFPSVPKAERNLWNKITKMGHGKTTAKGLISFLDRRDDLREDSSQRDSGSSTRIISILISLVALTGLFFFLVPSANIHIDPRITSQTKEIKVFLSPGISSINPSGGIPAFEKRIEVSAEQGLASSGVSKIPTKKAAGEVIFENLSDQPVVIPAGSVVTTEDPEGPKYVTVGEILLPAEKADASCPVEAVLAGEDGNTEKGRIVSLEGEMGSLVSVSNEKPVTGGESLIASSPNETDYAQLEKKLLEEIKEQATLLFISEMKDGEILVPESIAIEKILKNQRINPVGDPSDEARLRLTGRFIALSFLKTDEITILSMVLDGSLQDGFRPVGKTIEIERVGDIHMEQGRPTWLIRGSRDIIPAWDPDELAFVLVGKPKEEAQKIIAESVNQSRPAEISLLFNWWKRMPFLSSQIHFTGAGLE
ncbi:MAG: baseplate J/gp47 family protein [Chloroflexi bacterium]|nr:baseplate J/gp47 family protein [Chloroflexota bacterium]